MGLLRCAALLLYTSYRPSCSCGAALLYTLYRPLGSCCAALLLYTLYRPSGSCCAALLLYTYCATAYRCLYLLLQILELVQENLGDDIDADVRLIEAGLDSFAVVRLTRHVQAAVGLSVELPSTLIFDYPTARSITEYIADVQTPEVAS